MLESASQNGGDDGQVFKIHIVASAECWHRASPLLRHNAISFNNASAC